MGCGRSCVQVRRRRGRNHHYVKHAPGLARLKLLLGFPSPVEDAEDSQDTPGWLVVVVVMVMLIIMLP